jgi:hypothetical protein
MSMSDPVVAAVLAYYLEQRSLEICRVYVGYRTTRNYHLQDCPFSHCRL